MPPVKPVVLHKGSGSSPFLRPHRNPGLEVVSVTRGTLVWQVEGRSHVVKPGSIFFTLPWQAHGSVFDFEPGHHWDFVVLRLEMRNPMRPGQFAFPGALGFSSRETARISKLLRGVDTHVFPGTPELASVIWALARDLPEASPYEARRHAALAALAVVGLAERIETAPPTAPESIDTHRVSQVIDMLRQDVARPWTLNEVAACARLQKSRFCELFRRETGDTLIDFINRLRIEQARRLLKETDLPVTRIAQECGFGTSQYFAKIFRQFTTVSASEFRQSGFEGPGS